MLNLNQPAYLSVYESSVNTYLDISSTNAVVIYNNSAAIVVDADNISDYYKVKQCLSRSKSESVLFVNCNYDNEKLSSLAKNDKEFLNTYVSKNCQNYFRCLWSISPN